jgi:hypothetical protein
MSSQNFDSPTYTYILNVDDGVADDTAITGIAAKSGQFAFLDTGKTEVNAIAAGYDYYFATKDTGSVLHKSPAFNYSSVKNAVSKDQVARTEQITYVGYNGVSGSLDAANATYYSLGIVLNHTFGVLNNSPLMKTIPFKSTAATQSNIAAGLVNAGAVSFARGVNKDIKFERINSGAQLNAMASATAAVVNGSLTCFVGSILRMGTSGAGTAPCYIVKSIDGAGLVVVLDQPYQGATDATFAHGTIETVTEGDWGIKMTGVSITDANFSPTTDTPYVVDFDVELSENFVLPEVTYNTKSDIGFGTYQLVSFDEAFGLFNDKDKQVSAYPVQPGHVFETVSGSTYNLIEFEASDSKYSSATTGLNPISKFRIRIWYLDTTCDTDYASAKTTMAATAIS